MNPAAFKLWCRCQHLLQQMDTAPMTAAAAKHGRVRAAWIETLKARNDEQNLRATRRRITRHMKGSRLRSNRRRREILYSVALFIEANNRLPDPKEIIGRFPEDEWNCYRVEMSEVLSEIFG